MRKFGNERGIEIEAPHVEVAMMKAFFDLLDTTTILEVSNFPSEPVCPSCRSVCHTFMLILEQNWLHSDRALSTDVFIVYNTIKLLTHFFAIPLFLSPPPAPLLQQPSSPPPPPPLPRTTHHHIVLERVQRPEPGNVKVH